MERKYAVMTSNLIFAGIVTCNPDISRLSESLNAIISQVDDIVIFDNNSSNYAELESVTKVHKSCKLIKSNINIGIAGALNSLMKWGKDSGYVWMLSLDQDSICPKKYVSIMEKILNSVKHIGILAPTIVDENIGIVGHNSPEELFDVHTCITSGSISSIRAWESIGGYDEVLFIDSVDFDFCYRIRKAGYRVLQTNKAILNHKLGDSQKRRFILWHVEVNNHNAFRKYYIARNNIYYPKKNKLWIRMIRGNFRNVWLLIKVLLYENEKKSKMHAIIKGFKDAYCLKQRSYGKAIKTINVSEYDHR